jgi:hypothetical protein
MISVNLILRQWQGVLGYELQPLPGKHELPNDLLDQLLKAGLDMYIRRYIYSIVQHYNPIVQHDKYSQHNSHRPKTAPYLVYRHVPHHPTVLCITTADNTFYELLLNFDNLAQLRPTPSNQK